MMKALVWPLSDNQVRPFWSWKEENNQGKFSMVMSLCGQSLRQVGLLPCEGGGTCQGAMGCKHLADAQPLISSE